MPENQPPAAATYQVLMAYWPTLADLAADVGSPHGTILAWSSRGKIPRERWQQVVDAAARRGYSAVTLAALEAAATLPPEMSNRIEAKHSLRAKPQAAASRGG